MRLETGIKLGWQSPHPRDQQPHVGWAEATDLDPFVVCLLTCADTELAPLGGGRNTAILSDGGVDFSFQLSDYDM